MAHYSRSIVLSTFFCLFVFLGCEDASLGPDLSGSVEGVVLDEETNAPVAGASITTSPPSGAITTDAEGVFTLTDVPTGNYTINVRKQGYEPNNISISVRADQTTPATVLLERGTDFAGRGDSVTVEVINWANRTINADTTFVDVEYQVRNVGSVPIKAYEVYFRIVTNGDTFLEEQRGDTLLTSQADVRMFSKFVRSREASRVDIQEVWFEPVEQ